LTSATPPLMNDELTDQKELHEPWI